MKKKVIKFETVTKTLKNSKTKWTKNTVFNSKRGLGNASTTHQGKKYTISTMGDSYGMNGRSIIAYNGGWAIVHSNDQTYHLDTISPGFKKPSQAARWFDKNIVKPKKNKER